MEVRRQIRGQNELGDAVAGLDGADCVAVIVQRDEDFAPVVRINDADFIGRGQALLTGQAAALCRPVTRQSLRQEKLTTKLTGVLTKVIAPLL